MDIYIPTAGRSQQKTAELLDESGLDYTLVLTKGDNHPASTPNANILEARAERGIRAIRQFILEWAEGKFVMLDDDLRFYSRKSDGSFKKATPKSIRKMFEELDATLDIFAHAGITEKYMSQTRPRDRIYNARYYHILAYNKKLFPEPTPRFRCEVGEDHDMNLQLLLAGCDNCVLTEWANDDVSHAPGGCSLWRNHKIERQEAVHLGRLFPDIVKMKGKYIARINWKKAAGIGGCIYV
jgi:hypothetical protein